jgi:hypothetical protein
MDIRVEYASTTYPWIESVHKFTNCFYIHQPFAHQYDMASFSLPARKGTGDYIYHFIWGGYRDCVDVNIQAATVVNRYGTYNASATTTFVKLDHCEFYYVLNPVTPCQIVPQTTRSAATCINACRTAGNGCKAVQVVRRRNLPISLPYTEGLPLYAHDPLQLDDSVAPINVSGPCGYPSIHDRKEAGCTKAPTKCNLVNATDDDLICFGLTPFRDQNLQATEDFIISSDPADPRFFSTCWIKIPNSGFLATPSLSKPWPAWDVGDSCVTCPFRSQVRSLGLNFAPDWVDGLTGECINCDDGTV